MKTLIVAGDYPWPENAGSRLRLATTVGGLARLGPTDLVSVVRETRTDFDPPPDIPGLERIGRVGFDNRTDHGLELLGTLARPSKPLGLQWREAARIRQGVTDFMRGRYERIADFIKLHYCLTQRRDTPFWRDNADIRTVPESLQEKLAMWRCRPPHRLDFVTDLEMYLPASWQYVLYGMEYRTELPAAAARYPRMDEARREFAMIREMSRRAIADLPPHRDLVARMTALS